MHNRSIRDNKFNLPSMRNLWKTMGGYDALVEYNECAVRQFIREWQLNKNKNNTSHTDFIKKKSEEVGIHLGHIDFDKYRQEVYLWYLVHPYGCIDVFVREFKDDLQLFGYNINLDFKDKNAIEKLISGLKTAGIGITVEEYKLDLDRYYRRSRNLLAHKLDEKEKEKLTKIYKDLQKDKIFSWYPSLTEALSAPCYYTFDDFTLCTANLKNITDTLTTDVYNSIDWSKYDIEKTSIAKKFRGFLQNDDRLQRAIRTYIQNTYGITLPAEKLKILKEKLSTH